MDTIEVFLELVKAYSYKGKSSDRLIPLTNLTFFMGAGFSKSWDITSPTGMELFTFKVSDYSDDLTDFLRSNGYISESEIDFSIFKDLCYQISMQLKYPSLRKRYFDEVNLLMLQNELKSCIFKRFKQITQLSNYNYSTTKLQLPNITDSQKDIIKFFYWLKDNQTGDNNYLPEGLRVNYLSTNYDYIIETILDYTLADENHTLFSYRGFTPISINGLKPPIIVHDHWLVDNLIKINGGFEIVQRLDGYHIDYQSRTDEEVIANPPIIMLPNREQDYTDSYFQEIFPKAIRVLQESSVLVIVGTSLPEEDSLLRILIRQFAEERVDLTRKYIFYISPEASLDKLKTVFPYLADKKISRNVFVYSGTFNDWIKEINTKIK
jgi:hypothetical protein